MITISLLNNYSYQTQKQTQFVDRRMNNKHKTFQGVHINMRRMGASSSAARSSGYETRVVVPARTSREATILEHPNCSWILQEEKNCVGCKRDFHFQPHPPAKKICLWRKRPNPNNSFKLHFDCQFHCIKSNKMK